jgi:hypothetical protein
MQMQTETFVRRMADTIADKSAGALAQIMVQLIESLPRLRVQLAVLQERRLAEKFTRLMLSSPMPPIQPSMYTFALPGQCPDPDCTVCLAQRRRIVGQA